MEYTLQDKKRLLAGLSKSDVISLSEKRDMCLALRAHGDCSNIGLKIISAGPEDIERVWRFFGTHAIRNGEKDENIG